MKTINEIQDDNYKDLINESTMKIKDYIIEVSNRAQAEGKDVSEIIDEGLLSAIVGGIVGGTAGRNVMQAVCKALKVDEKGTLGQMLTSRLVLTAVGSYLGYKW